MNKKTYDFDEIIDRSDSNAMAVEGFRDYLFGDNNSIVFDYEDNELIPMWVADMSFAIAPEIITAIKNRLDRRTLGYTKVFDQSYSETFANWTRSRYDWSFNPEHLITSPGVIPALFQLIEYICKDDDKILIFTPSYAYFKHAADHNNIEVVSSPLMTNDSSFAIDFKDFESKAKDPKVTLCILCHPHNPTVHIWSEKELRRIAEICFNNNIIIISDEIHCDILREGKVHTPLVKLFPDSEKIITCMSPSKTFNLAGLLFANIIIPNQNIYKIWQDRHYIFENPLSIAAAQAAYSAGHEWLRQLSAYLDENFTFVKKYLEAKLSNAIFRIPEATYFAWIDVSHYFPKNENLTVFFAKNTGVLLEGGDMFVANANGYIRLNLACPRAIIEKALERIINVCKVR